MALLGRRLRSERFARDLLLAAALFCAALIGRFVVDNLVPQRLPFITYFPALAISGLFGGASATLLLLVALTASGVLLPSPVQTDPVAFRALMAALFFLSGGALVAIVARRAAAQTRLRQLEARTQLINVELKHRLKSVLGVIDAMIKQSAASATSVEQFSAEMTNRVQAIAAAQDLLKPQANEPAELIELIDVAVKPLIPSPQRIKITGTAATIPGDLIAPFALVLHELATNALKHGAWATPEGMVLVDCRRSPLTLSFSWQETAVAPGASAAGFGTAMIHRALPSATIEHERRPTGVSCRIELPLAG